MTKKIILTGDRPTGRMHLGHYVGSLCNRIKMQDDYKQYIIIADLQALTDNFENPEKINNSICEVVKDYISVGIDPMKSTIFVQSQIPELTELTFYYMNLVTVARLERNPTVKSELQQKAFGESIPAGFFCYPVSQAADITAFNADIVPVGADQLPMIEQTNEIVRKFNRLYNTDCLKEVEAVVGSTGRLIGIDGAEKAGKSLGNAIFLSDDKDTVKKKVFSMFTDPNHLKVSDPGRVEGNVVFAYLDAFCKDVEKVKELKDHYQRGGLGDTTIKSFLLQVLEEVMLPWREKRAVVSDELALDIISNGSREARKVARETLENVRRAIGIKNYT